MALGIRWFPAASYVRYASLQIPQNARSGFNQWKIFHLWVGRSIVRSTIRGYVL